MKPITQTTSRLASTGFRQQPRTPPQRQTNQLQYKTLSRGLLSTCLTSIICRLLPLVLAAHQVSVTSGSQWRGGSRSHHPFTGCCITGSLAALAVDANSPAKDCASILQLGRNVPIQVTDHETSLIDAQQSWCNRMQHLCCLASRRKRACRLSAEHVIVHKAKVNCSQLGDLAVEPTLTDVAKECCLCKAAWYSNTTEALQWRTSLHERNASVCPGLSCCALLKETDTEKSHATSSTELPEPVTIVSKVGISEEIVSNGLDKMFSDDANGDVDDYDLNFSGGLDSPEEEDYISHQDVSTQLYSTSTQTFEPGAIQSTQPEVTITTPTTVSTPATLVSLTSTSVPAYLHIESRSAITVSSSTSKDDADPNHDIEEKSRNLEPSSLNSGVKCRENFAWDATQELCVRLLTSCPIGMIFNKSTSKCVQKPEGLDDCPTGYRYNDTNGSCEDIDECVYGISTGILPCEGTGMQCINQPGTYNCTCESGFQMANDGTCVDINECNQRSNPCKQGQHCRNLLGSFQCLRQVPCGFGYVLNPENQQCEDVDECKVDPNICGHGMICINVRGGHKCVDKKCPGKSIRDRNGNCVPCGPGFMYNVSSGICEDVDECESQGINCAPWEKCVNKKGFYVCVKKKICEHGTRLNEDGAACVDIDECLEKSFTCGQDEICVNSPKSYVCEPSPCQRPQIFDYQQQKCICREGMREVDGTCQDINECDEDEKSCGDDESCINFVGGHRCVKTSKCLPGFNHDKETNSCQDIDECKTESAQCGDSMYCVNTIGSYQCMCKRGFKNIDSHTCVDVDECQLFGDQIACPDPRARCVNTNGSHFCICREGFSWLDYPVSKCADIDECSQKPDRCGMEHRCVNLEGGYRCECSSGYRNPGNPTACVDVDECQNLDQDGNPPCPKSMCVNTPGSYTCRCPEGFQLGRGGQCYDIDECSSLRGICASKYVSYGHSQTCVNLMGGYRCVSNTCPPSYEKSRLGNGYRCQLLSSQTCPPRDRNCLSQKPIRLDNLFIELDQHTSVPQILSRVNTLTLSSGMVRADLRQHYANQLSTRQPIDVGSAFKLQRSRTQPGTVEVMLTRQLPAPVDILISLHLTVVKDSKQITQDVTKFYIFVTQSPAERVQSAIKSAQTNRRSTYIWSNRRLRRSQRNMLYNT